MNDGTNILSHVIKNENDTTALLYALCAYRPFRDVLVRLCTQGQFGANDVQWEDLTTQMSLGGPIPDLVMVGQNVTIVIEVKITTWRGLTRNQPGAYLTWLAGRESGASAFFVALIPRRYVHLALLKSQIASFHQSNTQQPVTTAIVQWDDLSKQLVHHDLGHMNAYVRDFCQLLQSWYEAPLLTFRIEEVRSMYDSHTAKGIGKLLTIIEEVAAALQDRGYGVQRIFPKRWWEDQYALDIDDLLWFGLWKEYWEASGIPLCFGVGIEARWDHAHFKEHYPHANAFSSSEGTWYLVDIDKAVLLSTDPVTQIVSTLQKYLQSVQSQSDSPDGDSK